VVAPLLQKVHLPLHSLVGFHSAMQQFPAIMLGKPSGCCSLFKEKIQNHPASLSPS
jgi:hypothetical protein